MRRFFWNFLMALVCVFVVWHSAAAQDGNFDTTFASTGKTVFNISPSNKDSGSVVREASDGKLLVAGNCNGIVCLARLNADGSLDQTYGPTKLGYFRLDQIAFVGEASMSDMILLPDGRAAVLTCNSNQPYEIFIVKSDGSDLDKSLVNGQGYNSFDGSTCGVRVRRQTDGRFDVILPYKVTGYGYAMGVQRILSDLSGLDTAFGNEGTATVAFGLGGATGDDTVQALAIQPDGKIVVGGFADTGNAFILEIARLLPTGNLDDTFGNGDGRIHYTGNSGDTTISDLAVDSKQRIIFGGYIKYSGNFIRLVGRLTGAGQFDATFGTGGLSEFPLGYLGDAEVTSVVLSGDRIVIGSSLASLSGASDFSISLIDAAGHLASSFAGSGTTSGLFGPASSQSFPAGAIVTSQGIVITGYSTLNSSTQFGVARVVYGYIFSDSFE